MSDTTAPRPLCYGCGYPIEEYSYVWINGNTYHGACFNRTPLKHGDTIKYYPDIQELEAEIERLNNEYNRYIKLSDEVIDKAGDKIQELQVELNKMKAENEQMRKHCWRKPTHGPCCTCQRCGHYYNECKCDFDDVADENKRLREGLRRACLEFGADPDSWLQALEEGK